jgi:hypothetical protein
MGVSYEEETENKKLLDSFITRWKVLLANLKDEFGLYQRLFTKLESNTITRSIDGIRNARVHLPALWVSLAITDISSILTRNQRHHILMSSGLLNALRKSRVSRIFHVHHNGLQGRDVKTARRPNSQSPMARQQQYYET